MSRTVTPPGRVVVIGGGIAGLATAALLARDGSRVTLVEARDELGGRAGSWEQDGFRFDTGPSWYLMPEVFDHFFKLLGSSSDERLDLVKLDPGYRIWGEGYDEPLDIPAELSETLALAERMERGAGKRLAAYLEEAGRTYETAKEKFLYTTFDKLGPVLPSTGQIPTLTRLLIESLDAKVRHTVRDRRLRQVLGYPAVFLGSAPKLAPSMYSLMSHLDLVDGVRYPMGGFTGLIEQIADAARREGAELRTGASVERITHADGAANGVLLSTGEHLEADVVVSTADLHHSETELLDEPVRTYPEQWWDGRVAGPSALLMLLGVRGELPQLEHHTLFFAADWERGFDAIFGDHPRLPETPSLYVCKPSGVDPAVAPEGSENLFVLVPLPADPSIGSGGVDGDGDPAVEALGDRVLAQIADWAGIPDLASRVVVRRTIGPADFARDLHSWKGTALGPAHTLKQSAMFRGSNASRKLRNLYYAGGSTIPGIGLPMCLISAELVLKRLRGDTTAGAMPEPLVPRSAPEAAAGGARA